MASRAGRVRRLHGMANITHSQWRPSGTSSSSTSAKAAAWITTGLFCLAMTVSGVLYLVGPGAVVDGFRHLGYPDYFRAVLGIAKLMGVVAIVGAGSKRTLREWAYAGFTFDLIAASVSHVASGDGQAALVPILLLALLVGSYFSWHRPGAARGETIGGARASATVLSSVQDAGGQR